MGEVELVARDRVFGEEEEEALVGVGDLEVSNGEVYEGVGAGDEGFFVEVDAGVVEDPLAVVFVGADEGDLVHFDSSMICEAD